MINYEILEKTYINNLNFIYKHFRQLYDEIQNADLSNHEIFLEKNSEINIMVDGHKLYPENVTESIQLQFDVFDYTKPAIFQERPVVYIKDTGTIHDKLLLELQSCSDIVDLENNILKFNGYKSIDDSYPAMILFGVGNGSIIKKLISNSKLNHLYIIDKDYSMLKISMHLMDWTEIFMYFFDKKRSLMFIDVDSNEENIKNCSAKIINDLYKYNPMYCFNLHFLTHYSCEEFNTIKSDLQHRLQRALEGWGFFDDEINSLNHSIVNYKNNYPIYLGHSKSDIASEFDIYIVANGPSLDNDIENIKKAGDNAIIFSCGTAIKSLFKNNIKPDFHFEIERDIDVYDALTSALSDSYLKTIKLIGLNVLHPKVTELFGKTLLYLRDNDSGASLMPLRYPRLKYTNPSVANGAFNFALQLNPKNIYCFGMDMGTCNLQQHHSKSSDYYNDDSFLSKTKIHFNKTTAGNFRDIVFTEDFYLWTKQRIENCIIANKHKDTTIYNCSDGALILGTLPLKSNLISHTIYSHSKKQIISSIEKLFEQNNDLNSVKKILNQNLKHIDHIEKNIYNIFNKKQTISESLDEILQEFTDLSYEHQISRSLLSGTLKIITSLYYSHCMAMNKNNTDYKPLEQKTIEIIKKFLGIAKKELTLLIKTT